MGLSKIPSLVGSSSQEEKSVPGSGSFSQAALFIYKGETKSCVTQQESSHRRGFLCSQLPLLSWPSPPPKCPLSMGSSQGHTLCLLRCLPLSGPPELPGFTATFTSSQSSSVPKLPFPEPSCSCAKQTSPWLGHWPLGSVEVWDSHSFAACFPKLIVGAF